MKAKSKNKPLPYLPLTDDEKWEFVQIFLRAARRKREEARLKALAEAEAKGCTQSC